MNRQRVVAVTGLGAPGSGYSIAPRLVLTSAHVVPPTGSEVQVFRPGRAPEFTGTVVWRGTPSGRDDAALVRIDDAAWEPPPGAPPRWGRLVTDVPGTECTACGVPDLAQRPDRPVDTLQPSGTLTPGDRAVGNRYVMNVTGHPPAAREDGSSPWGGISGAALFSGDLLMGVLAVDPAGRAHAVLEAVPSYVLLHDPNFRAALAAYGPEVGTAMEPAEWQDLAEVAELDAMAGVIGSPAALLRARRQVVRFRGRTDLLRELTGWADQEGFGARLLYGPGGQGKTRLAQQLTNILTAKGWTTLWLRGDADPAALAALKDAAKPLLIVVDYAETRTSQLTSLLSAVARHCAGSPFKVLMLARTKGDWWDVLHRSNATAEDLLGGAPATYLAPLEPDPDESRADAYREAVDSYAGQLPRVRGWQEHDWPGVAKRLPRTPVDQRPGLDSALTLHMTALADLLDEASPTAILDADVEDRLLAHERRYWSTTASSASHRALNSLSLRTLTNALTAAFLLGAEDRLQGDALLKRVPGLTDQSEDCRFSVREWIAGLYPSTGTGPWDTLQPDRLAERFIGRKLVDDPSLAKALAPGATDLQATQLLTVYARAAAQPALNRQLDDALTALCVQHPALLTAPAIGVVTQTEDPAPLLKALHHIVTDETADLDWDELEGQLPEFSHRLASWAVLLLQRLVVQHRGNVGDPALLARSLNNLSNRLSDLGRTEEAHTAITEATTTYRELADAQPDTYRPDLATSLNNLSNHLGDLGRTEEAHTAITEATTTYRELADAQPDTYRPDLATSLNNLSNHLGDLGRTEEAHTAITEATTTYRELADAQPDTYRPDLATSLNNLSNHLGDLGRTEEAHTAITEAIAILSELAAARPVVHQADLEQSLRVLAWLQGIDDEGEAE